MAVTFRTVDIETSGIDPAEHEIIEIGWRDMVIETPKASTALAPWYEATFVKAQKPIPIESSAVHHIMAGDLDVAPPRDLAISKIAGADYYIAHNADFEIGFLPELSDAPWICTYKAALRLLPDLPKHNNQYLRYHFGVALGREERETLFPHRAGPDAYVTALIFMRLRALASLEELVRISSLPPLMAKFGFGKHKGEPLHAIDRGYFGWIFGEDFDEGVRHSCAVEIARRNGGDHELYFTLAAAALVLAQDKAALTNWWLAEKPNRVKHHVQPKTPLYDRLVAACAAKAATLPERLVDDESGVA